MRITNTDTRGHLAPPSPLRTAPRTALRTALAAILCAAAFSCATGPGRAYAGTARFAPEGSFLFAESESPAKLLGAADASLSKFMAVLGEAGAVDLSGSSSADMERLASAMAGKFIGALYPDKGIAALDQERAAGLFIHGDAKDGLRGALALPLAEGLGAPANSPDASILLREGYLLMDFPLTPAAKPGKDIAARNGNYAPDPRYGGGSAYFIAKLPPRVDEGAGFSCDLKRMMAALGAGPDVLRKSLESGAAGVPAGAGIVGALADAIEQGNNLSGALRFGPEGIGAEITVDFESGGSASKFVGGLRAPKGTPARDMAAFMPPSVPIVVAAEYGESMRKMGVDFAGSALLAAMSEAPGAADIAAAWKSLAPSIAEVAALYRGGCAFGLDADVGAAMRDPSYGGAGAGRTALSAVLGSLPPFAIIVDKVNGLPGPFSGLFVSECVDTAKAAGLLKALFARPDLAAILGPAAKDRGLKAIALSEGTGAGLPLQTLRLEFGPAKAGEDPEVVECAIAYGAGIVCAASGDDAAARALKLASTAVSGGFTGGFAGGPGKAAIDLMDEEDFGFIFADFGALAGTDEPGPFAMTISAGANRVGFKLYLGYDAISAAMKLSKASEALAAPPAPAGDPEDYLAEMGRSYESLVSTLDELEAFLAREPSADEVREELPPYLDAIRAETAAFLEAMAAYASGMDAEADSFTRATEAFQDAMERIKGLRGSLGDYLSGEALDAAEEAFDAGLGEVE